MDKKSFSQLKGDRICFIPLRTQDAEVIHSYASDPAVSRYIGWALKHELKDTEDYILEMLRRESVGTHLYASVVSSETQEIVGTAMLFNFDKEAEHAEVGYVLHQKHWGKGYGTELVKMIVNYAAQTLDLHRLHARVVSGNVGSARILEKNGFVIEGRLKDHYKIEGQYEDGLILGKLL